MTTSNFSQMYRALMQAQTGVHEFLQLWAEQLPEDRLAQVTDWLQMGIRPGLHFVGAGAAPLVEITITDAAGNHRVLERLDFAKVRK